MKIVLTFLLIVALVSVAVGATELTASACIPPAVAQAWS